MAAKTGKQSHLKGRRIEPTPISADTGLVDLVDGTMLAYNGARLREACQLFAKEMLESDVTVGLSLSGALTPAGLGVAALIPLVKAGFVDWIVSTGANLYHDAHFALGYSLHRGRHDADDVMLRDEGVVRIYDVFVDYGALLRTDDFIREVSKQPEFQRSMSTAAPVWRPTTIMRLGSAR